MSSCLVSSKLACIAGNTQWQVWLACLNPFKGLPHSFQPHIVAMPSSSMPSNQLYQAEMHQQHSIIHAAGWLFSCASALWLQHHLSNTLPRTGPQHDHSCHELLLHQIVNGFWVTAVTAVASDLLGYQPATTAAEGQRRFCCGNFGLMLADSCNQSVDIVKVPI